MEYINEQDAMSRLSNNKSLYLRLLKKFDGNKMLDDLLTKIESGDVVSAEASAHTLKGIAANLSLEDLRFHAEAIDSKLKTGNINVDTSEIVLSNTKTVEAVNEWIAANS